MSFPTMRGVRWNIYARELEDVLRAHGLEISKLDDLGVAHPQKVARLRQSLEVPTSFPTLNPQELGLLEANVPLTADERARLRAAMAAAAVERALMDREDAHTALMAADDVFHILLARLHREPDSPLATVRGGVGFVPASGESDPYTVALDSIDRGTLALHTARDATGRAKDANVAAAESAFARALELLVPLQPPAGGAAATAAAWHAARDEALAGHAAIAALLMPAGAHTPARDDEGGTL